MSNTQLLIIFNYSAFRPEGLVNCLQEIIPVEHKRCLMFVGMTLGVAQDRVSYTASVPLGGEVCMDGGQCSRYSTSHDVYNSTVGGR